MAFSDPQTVTINAVPHSLARVNTSNGIGTFTKDDGTVLVTISHQPGRKTRRALRLTFSKIAADPLVSGVNLKYTTTAELVINEPPVGFSRTEMKQVVDGLIAYLNASSGANIVKLLAGEN